MGKRFSSRPIGLFLSRWRETLVGGSVVFWAACIFLPSQAKADFLFHPLEDPFEVNENRWGILKLKPTGFAYFSSNNLDFNGDSVIPGNLDLYNRFQVDVDANFGITRDLLVFGRFSWARVGVSTLDGSSASAYGLPDQMLGAVYRLWRSRTGNSIDALVRFDLPGYNNETAQTESTPFLGDGTTDITGAGFINFAIAREAQSTYAITVGAGFTWRSDDFSAAIPWSARAKLLRNTEGFEFFAGASGTQSLETDEATARVDGNLEGSLAVNGINPSFFGVDVGVGYRFSPRAKLEGRFNYPLTGNSISQGPLFAAGFEWTIGEDAQREPDPRQVSPEEYGKSNKGFVTYTGDATVVRVNDRFNLIKIDKGANHGVVKGQIFDIFEVETDGRIKGAVARAVVTEVNPDESALRIKEYFKEVLIEQGFTAKALIE